MLENLDREVNEYALAPALGLKGFASSYSARSETNSKKFITTRDAQYQQVSQLLQQLDQQLKQQVQQPELTLGIERSGI